MIGAPMGAIDLLYSSPIPVILAMGLNAFLMAGYWFFVFPMMDELKALRKRSAEFDANYLQSADAIKQMSQILEEIREAVERPVSNQDVNAVVAVCENIMVSINDIRVNLGKDNPRERAELLNQVDNIERNSERILRTISEVSEKQSQVTGLILGINMQRGTPPRGV
jgi:hypothetical protein